MNIFRKIASISLSILLLVSTTSFVVDEHYCGNMLVDATIFGKASNCFCEEYDNSKIKDNLSIESDSCCSENQIIHESNNEIKKVLNELSSENSLFLHSYFYTYIDLFEGLENSFTPFRNYLPPLIITDIQVINEAFLI